MPRETDNQKTDEDVTRTPQDRELAGATGEPEGDEASVGGPAPASEFATEAGGESTEELTRPQLEAELQQSRQRALRLQAELENYRKRTQRTMEEERRYACLPLMRDLLTVVDNLQRAIDAAEKNENAAGLLEGVKMVEEQLHGVLKRHHCEPIEAQDAPFDPHLHEAIAQHPSEDHEPGHVSMVTQVGYQLHGRVIRPSQVIVAAPRPETESDD